MLDGLPRSTMARALEPSVVLAIPYPPVLELLQSEPDLLWGVTKMLATRLRNMDEALADSVFLDVTGRTAKRLLELADGADEFILPVTQEELAGMVGASRERVNKAIASFIRLGWIEQHDRRYRILQRDRLTLRRPLSRRSAQRATPRTRPRRRRRRRPGGQSRAGSWTKAWVGLGVARRGDTQLPRGRRRRRAGCTGRARR